jgi:phosphoribosylformylglycinamidine synthase PurS subunit
MKYEIYVTLRNGILDKAGNAIAKVLDDRYGGVKSVRIGKTIYLECNEKDIENIAKEVTNEVMEDYEIQTCISIG